MSTSWTEPAPPNSPRPSIRWRFSLRAMLLLLLLMSLGIGLPRQRSISQHQAASRLRARGAEFEFAEQTQATWNWLVFGDNRYDFVYRIAFCESALSAKDLTNIRVFPDLYELRLTDCRLDSAATRKLGSLGNMRGLRIERGSLQGLDSLAWEPLSELEWLVLEDLDLSPLDCRRMQVLAKCTTLGLVSSQLTDAQVQPLNLPSLNMVRLQGKELSDAGLTFLAHSPDLQFLTVNDSQVSGRGVRFLHPNVKLLALNLNGSAVSPAGLEEIAKLHSLTMLQVRSTPLTAKDIEKFKANRPHCAVLGDRE